MFGHKKSMLKLKKFKSSFPQQELRRAKPVHCINDDNSDADEEEGIRLFLNSLEGLNQDYGSYAPLVL